MREDRTTGTTAEPSLAVSGAERIAAERERQIQQEGWTPEHDAEHLRGELATAGACYALLVSRWADSSILGERLLWKLWPWDLEWFKPADYPDPPYDANVHRDKHVKNLVRAGALIAAEIDRLLLDTADCQQSAAKDGVSP